MKVLVTGASGFVGKPLCEALLKHGINVSAIVRTPEQQIKGVELVVHDLHAKTNLQKYLKGIDVVIHLAGRAHVMKEPYLNPYDAYYEANVRITETLAEQAALCEVKRFIYLSSVKVNGESTNESPFIEKDIPRPEDNYGKTKHEAEKILKKVAKNSAMELIIIRPPLVYGAGVKANFKALISLSCSRLPLPFACAENKRSLIFVGNLIDFIMLCIQHPKAANQTFLISDGDDVSTREMVLTISAAKKISTILVPLPEKWIRLIFRLAGKQMLAERLFGSLQVDINKAKTLLNWSPPFSFKEGISRTLKIDKFK